MIHGDTVNEGKDCSQYWWRGTFTGHFEFIAVGTHSFSGESCWTLLFMAGNDMVSLSCFPRTSIHWMTVPLVPLVPTNSSTTAGGGTQFIGLVSHRMVEMQLFQLTHPIAAGGVSYDDITLWPNLRRLTIAKGVLWPEKLRKYLLYMEDLCDVPILEVMAIWKSEATSRSSFVGPLGPHRWQETHQFSCRKMPAADVLSIPWRGGWGADWNFALVSNCTFSYQSHACFFVLNSYSTGPIESWWNSGYSSQWPIFQEMFFQKM